MERIICIKIDRFNVTNTDKDLNRPRKNRCSLSRKLAFIISQKTQIATQCCDRCIDDRYTTKMQ